MPSNIKTSDFDYTLPEKLIAQKPASKRDRSKLMVIDKSKGKLQHTIFKNIINYLQPSDVLVLNDTRVIPARLFGLKMGGGAKIEVLLHRKIEAKTWEVLAKPAKRLKIGTVIKFGKLLSASTIGGTPDGKRVLRFIYTGDFDKLLAKKGLVPLPPYVKSNYNNELVKRYQTVYASKEGATAAPTAGLHFTSELLKAIGEHGVQIEYATLHTGLGTFQPVKTEYIKDHKIHSEEFKIDGKTADRIRQAKKDGRRIIAVGTTVVRLLESLDETGKTSGETTLFITPGYKFKIIDAMITNFHLPRSTLLMLVSAFAQVASADRSAFAGRNLIMKAYSVAVKRRYRFFSFGDAMFIN